MYGWIWRHLPFGLPGKIIGSLLLVIMVVLVLWNWVFPAAEPLLPFDDVQVEGPGPAGDTGGGQQGDTGGSPQPGGGELPGDPTDGSSPTN